MTLRQAAEGKQYRINQIGTNDAELNAFLSTLGCCEGQDIVVVAHRRSGCTVCLRDGRYSFDSKLAEAISVSMA
ncbi:MAG: ferrous iron transport protein A [Coriobacteriia bacterium]|nr:ferrous iron transport protein A [Coriobacteriia bacterium]